MHISSQRAGRNIRRFLIYTVLIIAAFIALFPFIWMVSTTFKSMSDLYSMPPTLFPKNVTFDNYIEGWEGADFSKYFLNTLIVTLAATCGTVLSSSIVAYGFARYKARFSSLFFAVLLGTMMLPSQVTLIPQYLLFYKMKMIDTYWPLIIPSWLGGGAFNIFLFTQFFRTIPRELDEAAKVDGANSLQVFMSILLPSVKPVMMAVLVMSLVYNWNDFFNPLIYLNSNEKFTIAIGLQFFKGSQGNVQVGQMMAMAFVSLIPILILFVFCQRYFIEGIKMSGLKA